MSGRGNRQEEQTTSEGERRGDGEKGYRRKMEKDREGKGLTDLMCPLTHKAGLEI